MSSYARSSAHAQIGPIQGEPPQCAHGSDAVLPIDPDPRHLQPCEQSAVFYVPVAGTFGRYAVCKWHLARAIEALSSESQATVLLDHDAQAHVPEHAFVTLADVPEQYRIAGYEWHRIGLDQRGHAHFVTPGAGLVVVLDERFDLVVRAQRLGDRGLTGEEGWLEHVRQVRGWAAFDERVAPDEMAQEGRR